jgi:hypothetical protein
VPTVPSADSTSSSRRRFIWLIILLPAVHAVAGLGADALRLARTIPPRGAVDGLSALDKSATGVLQLLPRGAVLRYDPAPGDDEAITHFHLQYVFAPTLVHVGGEADFVVSRKTPAGYERMAVLAGGLSIFRRP